MERAIHQYSLNIGDKAPYFSLRATDGKIYTISDFGGRNALVIIFTCNHCPYSQAYDQRLCELSRDYKEQGVAFVAVSANDPVMYPEESFEKMVERSRELGFPYPYLQDEMQIMAQAYDAACTPEIFLFDSDLRLRYHGCVDDNHHQPSLVTRHYLKEALDAVLSGEAPDPALTPVLGCSIKWKL